MIKLSKDQVIIGIIAFLLGITSGYILFGENLSTDFSTNLLLNDELNNSEDIIINKSRQENQKNISDEAKTIKVYITGSVKKPGVYSIKEGDRVIDLFQKAGGETIGADLEKINMASYLKDGEKIYIPSVTENNKFNSYSTTSSYNSNSKLININLANQNELQKLSGIGPSKAKAIIKYREKNGSFKNIKDLIKVSGIGNATLNKIEDEVSLR